MKPKNKFQSKVVEASKTLPKLTKEEIVWGYNNVIDHIAQTTEKGKITCTKCGHSWQSEGKQKSVPKKCTCPKCNTKLHVETTKNRIFNNMYYMTIITAHSGYQVLRTVVLLSFAKVGETVRYDYSEVMQRWIAPDGKHCTFAKLRQTMGTCYYDSWIYNTSLELRDENSNNKFYINVYNKIYTGIVYHRQKLIPELKRTGYKKSLYGQKPLNLFRTLLTDSRAETLIKTGNSKLLTHMMDNDWKNIENYWTSIRICIRNDYKIKDAILWCDYIDLLRHFGKDLHSARYVCPDDLHKEHDVFMNRKARQEAKIEKEKNLKNFLKNEPKYKEAKSKFFGLQFTDGLIQIKVLESVEAIMLEGKALHHCVYTNNYYLKDNSLILSATIDGKRIETIELSLTRWKILQSMGLCNKPTKYNKKIIKLVNKNLPLIQQRFTA